MEKKFEEIDVIEAYEKPSMQIIEMETEAVLMQGASKTSQDGMTNSLIDDDAATDKSVPTSTFKASQRTYTAPPSNTKPYMGTPSE